MIEEDQANTFKKSSNKIAHNQMLHLVHCTCSKHCPDVSANVGQLYCCNYIVHGYQFTLIMGLMITSLKIIGLIAANHNQNNNKNVQHRCPPLNVCS